MSDALNFETVRDGKADTAAAIEHALKHGKGDVEFPRGNSGFLLDRRRMDRLQ